MKMTPGYQGIDGGILSYRRPVGFTFNMGFYIIFLY